MRIRPLAVLGALLLLSAARAGRTGDAPSPAPRGRLEVPERVYDAGKIERGVTLRHTFLLKNIGTAQLSIDAKPG